MDLTAQAAAAPGLTGVLIVNLGTPDSPSVSDVRKYLREFLMDGRVIDIPALQRSLLVNGIIAPFRAPKSAKLYQKIWDAKTGSPLKHYGYELERLLQTELGEGYKVRLAMRYESPSIREGLEVFKSLPIRRLIVLPLFPQYASATTGSVVQEVMEVVGTWQVVPDVQFINRFFDDPGFIKSFAAMARPILQSRQWDRVLFSYHGLPERQIYKADNQGVCKLGSCCDAYTERNQWCYRAQCFATTRLLAQALAIDPAICATSFQSRLGKAVWVQPYTEDVIKQWAVEGVQSVAAFSPAFVADCLETILEVGEEYRDLFESLGGKHWELIPSLNDTAPWVKTCAKLVRSGAERAVLA